MTLTIFKYCLFRAITRLPLHDGWKCRMVDVKDGMPHLWVELDLSAPLVQAEILRVPTGGNVPHDCMYLGSVLLHDGQLVWHYYSRTLPL